jgi:hypothetical protein
MPQPSAAVVRGSSVKDRGEAVAARHWHKLDDGRIQCDLCLREIAQKVGSSTSVGPSGS